MSEFGVGIVIAVLIWLIGSVLRLLGRIADDVAVIREKLDTANQHHKESELLLRQIDDREWNRDCQRNPGLRP